MLITKLHIPPTSVNNVHRTDALQKLDEGLHKKLILVSAPAGFGKTNLLSDWINRSKMATAWYAIDKRDNDPIEFLRYIIEGIRTFRNDFGAKTMQLLNAPHRPDIESTLSLLINEIESDKTDFLVVFDDFHLINSREIYRIIEFFLDFIPPQIHLVISTRSDPQIPLSRLRSQNQLIEIRSSDLNFSTNETHVFLNKKLKLGLTQENINLLNLKTEGWIAGLQLTALSIKGRNDISAFIADFTGDNRYIMDYLIEEVLEMQPVPTKEFLLSTSILEQFSASVCDDLLGIDNSQSILESLDKNNMFIIPLDSERKWYRFHHLFADLLKQRLKIERKGDIQNLHEKASLWFEKNGRIEFSIDHAIEAENFSRAMHLLNSTIEKLWEFGYHTAIIKYGELIPDHIIEENPGFCFYYSWVLISAVRLDEAKRFLTAAEKKLKENTEFKDKALLGKISLAFTYLLSNSENPDEIFKYCKQAQENLSEADPLWYSWAWFAYGTAYLIKGDVIESNKCFAKALKYGLKSGNLYLISTTIIRLAYGEMRIGNYSFAYKKCMELLKLINDGGYAQMAKNQWSYAGLYSLLAHIQNIWNQMDEALENAKIGYELCKKGEDVTTKFFNIIIYSRVLLTRGDISGVEETLARLNALDVEKLRSNELKVVLNAWRIVVNVKQNKLYESTEILKSIQNVINEKPSFSNELINIAYARLLIAQFKLNDAAILLNELRKLSFDGNRIERLVEVNILIAILNQIKGDKENAMFHLSEAIVLAEKENLIMFFVLDGDEIRPTLKEIHQIKSNTTNKIPFKFLNKIIQAIDNREKLLNRSEQTVLSGREIEVLQLIATDFSNKQIAEKLFVSLNTAKTHIKNIYLKLEVDSRNKAIQEAKRLGIL